MKGTKKMQRKKTVARRNRNRQFTNPHSQRKFVVVSKPNAVLLVERIELTPAEVRGLTVDAKIIGEVEAQQNGEKALEEAT